jgi:tetratricopeptide (TPR) repeat protein
LLLLLALLGCQSTALTAAKLYIQQNEPQKAEEQLHQALQTEPQNPEAHFLLGQLCADQGNYQEMAASFARSLELSPKFAPQIQDLRQHYWAREYNEGVRQASAQPPDFPGALGAFQLATVIDPDRLESWRNLAYVYYQLDSLDTTIRTYRHILSIAPSDTSTLYSIGVLCLKQGRSQEAVQALAEFNRLRPGHVEGLVNLAVAHVEQGELAEAERIYLQAAQATPQDHRPHYNLGNLYFNQKNYPAALAAYQRAAELAPEDQDSRFNLAVAHLALEQMDSAFPILQQLAEQNPDNAAVWRELGRIHAIKGRVQESEKAYARADSLGL